MKNNENFGIFDSKYIITVASWEERFLLGSKKLINKFKPKYFLMSYCEEYAHLSEKNRKEVEDYCKKKFINVVENPLSFKEPKKSWNSIRNFLYSNSIQKENIVLDISTMPRETIWTTLSFLEFLECKIAFVYNTPKSYNDDWLSQEPDIPRIVFKLGGISKVGAPTSLVIISGFDIDRVYQLISFFEPELTFLGIQSGKQMKNQEKNIRKCENEFKNNKNVKLFSLDAYSQDYGFQSIDNIISKLLPEYNIVVSSLGPKLSAITLYRLHKKYPDIALSYAPSKKFNPDYSFGLGKTFIDFV